MALEEKTAQITKLKEKLDSLPVIKLEDEKRLWEKIRLDWNYNSNSIEGNTLTYNETKLLLIFEEISGDHAKREFDEMEAHDVAIHMVKEWAKDKVRDLTERDIRELNKIILVQPYWKDAITPDHQPTKRQIKVGEYKAQPNSVLLKSGETFEFTSPLETPLQMEALMKWYRDNEGEHPLILASQFHYKFIRIHPFDDGNGRVVRLLVNYILMKKGYPPIIIRSDEKEKYLLALHKADSGDIAAFDEYMAEQLIRSLELTINATEGKDITEPGDFDKELQQIELKLKNEQAEVVKRNPQLVANIYEKSIRPLTEALYEKLTKFNSLFAEFEITVFKDGSGQSGDKQQHDISLNDYFSAQNAREIYINYNWRAFNRAAPNVFDAYAELRVELDDFNYRINTDRSADKHMYKKLYSQQLTQQEINNIIDKTANKVLIDIKEQYKRFTGKEL